MKLWDLGLEAHFSLYVVTDLANSGPTPRAQMLYNALKLGAGGSVGRSFQIPAPVGAAQIFLQKRFE